jgi:hypothetical protein
MLSSTSSERQSRLPYLAGRCTNLVLQAQHLDCLRGVTDWSMPKPEFEAERQSLFERYHASKGRRAYAAIHIGTVLEIKGFVVAQIIHYLGMAPDSGTDHLRATIRRWEDEWKHVIQFASPSPSAFWRTMCADTLYSAAGTRARQVSTKTPLNGQHGAVKRHTSLGYQTKEPNGIDTPASWVMPWRMLYQEPVDMKRRKNSYHFAVQPSLVSRKFFA